MYTLMLLYISMITHRMEHPHQVDTCLYPALVLLLTYRTSTFKVTKRAVSVMSWFVATSPPCMLVSCPSRLWSPGSQIMEVNGAAFEARFCLKHHSALRTVYLFHILPSLPSHVHTCASSLPSIFPAPSIALPSCSCPHVCLGFTSVGNRELKNLKSHNELLASEVDKGSLTSDVCPQLTNKCTPPCWNMSFVAAVMRDASL